MSRRNRRTPSAPATPPTTTNVVDLRLKAAEVVAKSALDRLDATVERKDRWVNYQTGLGTFKDKTRHGFFEQPIRLTDAEITSLASGNHLAAKAIEKRPFEMFRRGYELEPEGGEDDAIDNGDVDELRKYAIERLKLDERMRQGMVFGRQYGGSILILGIDDGRDPWEPVDEKNIKNINFINQVDRRYSYVQSYYSDYMSPDYGEAETYLVANAVATSTYRSSDNTTFRVKRTQGLPKGTNYAKSPSGGYSILNVHESRIIRFDGVEPDVLTRQILAGWSWSVLQRAYETLRQCDMGFDALAYLISDASQGVMKLKGLLAGLSVPGQRAAVEKRMEMIDEQRSVMRSIAVDPSGGEDFTRVTTPLTGIPDAIDRLMQLLAAAFDMPVTELFGTPPTGLNATGENDRVHWYDTIATDQANVLAPRLKRVYRLLALSKNGPMGGKDLNWKIKFNPLHTPTESDIAQTRFLNAQRDNLYLTQQVVNTNEVAVTLGDVYPHMDMTSREAALKAAPLIPTHPGAPPPGAPGAPPPPGAPPAPGGPPTGGQPDPTGGAGASGDFPEGQSPTIPLPGSALHTGVAPAGEGKGTPGDPGTGGGSKPVESVTGANPPKPATSNAGAPGTTPGKAHPELPAAAGIPHVAIHPDEKKPVYAHSKGEAKKEAAKLVEKNGGKAQVMPTSEFLAKQQKWEKARHPKGQFLPKPDTKDWNDLVRDSETVAVDFQQKIDAGVPHMVVPKGGGPPQFHPSKRAALEHVATLSAAGQSADVMTAEEFARAASAKLPPRASGGIWVARGATLTPAPDPASSSEAAKLPTDFGVAVPAAGSHCSNCKFLVTGAPPTCGNETFAQWVKLRTGQGTGAPPAPIPASDPARYCCSAWQADPTALKADNDQDGDVDAAKPVLTPVNDPQPVPLPDASVGILRNGKQVLVIRATTGWRGHVWALPGGESVPGESPEGTLRRELAEEIGIVATEIEHATDFVCPTDNRTVHAFYVKSWLGEITPDRSEVRTVRWMMPVGLMGGAGRWRKSILALMTSGILGGKAESENGPKSAAARMYEVVMKNGGFDVDGSGSFGSMTGIKNRAQHAADSRYDGSGWDLDDAQALWRLDKLTETRPDGKMAGTVFRQLLADYPASALGWVVAAHWHGPVDVPIEDIDTSNRDKWTASKDGKIARHAHMIKEGKSPPAILVKPAGEDKYIIVDGHHRTLANEALGRPVTAYVAEVHVKHGPWDELHSMQKRGSSKGTQASMPSWTSVNGIDPEQVKEDGTPIERRLERMRARKTDAEWDESQHPSASNGQFGGGEGSALGSGGQTDKDFAAALGSILAHQKVSAGIDKIAASTLTGVDLVDYVQRGVEDITKQSGWTAKDLGAMLLDFDEGQERTHGDSASKLSDASKKSLVDAIVAEVLKRRASRADDFDESQHPRAPNGQFGEGSGGSEGSAPKAGSSPATAESYFKADKGRLARLRAYTEFDYAKMNEFQRDPVKYAMTHGEKDADKQHDKADALTRDLKAAPKEPGVASRGVMLPKDAIEKLKAGATTYVRGTWSATKDHEQAEGFAHQTAEGAVKKGDPRQPVLLHITHKSGVSLGNATTRPEEKEVLLSNGTKLHVDKTERKGGMLHVHLSEVE